MINVWRFCKDRAPEQNRKEQNMKKKKWPIRSFQSISIPAICSNRLNSLQTEQALFFGVLQASAQASAKHEKSAESESRATGVTHVLRLSRASRSPSHSPAKRRKITPVLQATLKRFSAFTKSLVTELCLYFWGALAFLMARQWPFILKLKLTILLQLASFLTIDPFALKNYPPDHLSYNLRCTCCSKETSH